MSPTLARLLALAFFAGLARCDEEGNPCLLEKEVGLCYAVQVKYYYDTTTKQCREFNYGGCGGNANNFETMRDCKAKCQR